MSKSTLQLLLAWLIEQDAPVVLVNGLTDHPKYQYIQLRWIHDIKIATIDDSFIVSLLGRPQPFHMADPDCFEKVLQCLNMAEHEYRLSHCMSSDEFKQHTY